MTNVFKKILIISIVLIMLAAISLGSYYLWLVSNQITQRDAVYTDEIRYIAHRGLSSEYYQNTKGAFIAAGQTSFFYGIETDVWLTKDGVWVCSHDINPFTDTKIKITEIDYATAMSTPLNPAKKRYDFVLDGDVFLCDFVTYLNICKQYDKVPIIEIKQQASKKELDNLLDITASVMDLQSVHYISFNKKAVDILLLADKDLSVQLLTQKRIPAFFASTRGYNLGIKDTILTKSLITKMHKKNCYINVWTVNDKKQAEKLAAMGVDFITTDFIL